MSTTFSYWLLPSEPAATALRRQIHNLATATGAPAFEPHVTLYSGPSDEDEVARVVAHLHSFFRPLTIAPYTIAESERLTKTLFVRVRRETGLAALHDAIREHSARASEYTFNDPHVSLLYQALPAAERMARAARIMLPPPFAADGIEAIALETPVTRPEQIRDWRSVARFRYGE